MNQLLLVRSSLVGYSNETDDTLARCVNVRETCRILHTRGAASLADCLTHDFDATRAVGLSLELQAFVAAESRPRYFRSYHKLLQDDDADEILTTALWLKRAARARCRIWLQMGDGRDRAPYPVDDAVTATIVRPYLVALPASEKEGRPGDNDEPADP